MSHIRAGRQSSYSIAIMEMKSPACWLHQERCMAWNGPWNDNAICKETLMPENIRVHYPQEASLRTATIPAFYVWLGIDSKSYTNLGSFIETIQKFNHLMQFSTPKNSHSIPGLLKWIILRARKDNMKLTHCWSLTCLIPIQTLRLQTEISLVGSPTTIVRSNFHLDSKYKYCPANQSQFTKIQTDVPQINFDSHFRDLENKHLKWMD